MNTISEPPADIGALHDDAAGVLKLILLTAEDAAELIAAAAAGDARAGSYLRAVDTFQRQIDRQGQLCLTCDRQLAAGRLLIALVVPGRDDPARCLAVGVCETCVAMQSDRGAVEAAVAAALRKLLWPDLRRIAAPLSSSYGRH